MEYEIECCREEMFRFGEGEILDMKSDGEFDMMLNGDEMERFWQRWFLTGGKQRSEIK